MNKPLYISLLILGCLFIVSCSGEKSFTTIKINGNNYTIETAVTPAERQKGLMFRESLDADSGMIFVFEREQPRSFWMKDTQIPLDIAFIAKDGTIREIYPLVPFSLDPVKSKFSALYALEVNRGFFEKEGIVTGDTIILPSELIPQH